MAAEKVWGCEYECGFVGLFDLCSAHEEVCPLRDGSGAEDEGSDLFGCARAQLAAELCDGGSADAHPAWDAGLEAEVAALADALRARGGWLSPLRRGWATGARIGAGWQLLLTLPVPMTEEAVATAAAAAATTTAGCDCCPPGAGGGSECGAAVGGPAGGLDTTEQLPAALPSVPSPSRGTRRAAPARKAVVIGDRESGGVSPPRGGEAAAAAEEEEEEEEEEEAGGGAYLRPLLVQVTLPRGYLAGAPTAPPQPPPQPLVGVPVTARLPALRVAEPLSHPHISDAGFVSDTFYAALAADAAAPAAPGESEPEVAGSGAGVLGAAVELLEQLLCRALDPAMAAVPGGAWQGADTPLTDAELHVAWTANHCAVAAARAQLQAARPQLSPADADSALAGLAPLPWHELFHDMPYEAYLRAAPGSEARAALEAQARARFEERVRPARYGVAAALEASRALPLLERCGAAAECRGGSGPGTGRGRRSYGSRALHPWLFGRAAEPPPATPATPAAATATAVATAPRDAAGKMALSHAATHALCTQPFGSDAAGEGFLDPAFRRIIRVAQLARGDGDGGDGDGGGGGGGAAALRDSGLVREEGAAGSGVFSFPLLTEGACTALVAELRAFEAADDLPKKRPNSMNRHGQVVNDAGMAPLVCGLLRQCIRPLAAALYGGGGADGAFARTLDYHHAFAVRYRAGEDLSLDMHIDDAEVTLNVNLLADYAAAGSGGLRFCGMQADRDRRRSALRISDGGGDDDGGGGGSSGDDAVFKHQRGRAVLHLGKRRHGAEPIAPVAEDGGAAAAAMAADGDGHGCERINLIVWCRSAAHRADACGDHGAYAASLRPPDDELEPELVCLSRTHDDDDEAWRIRLGSVDVDDQNERDER